MSSITGERSLDLPSRRWLDRLLAQEIGVSTELLAFFGLVALAFVLHFWDLGSRALHHDESLHATYSYYLYKGQGYHHDPLMHGPVLFHFTALMYLLFGATNATSRFSAALAGTALVFAPYFLRQWLGRWGALAASALLLISPSALYYSRFIREDIFVALWTAGLFIGVWRYSRSRQAVWLYLAAACLALGFANKEITYMFAAILLVYTDVLLAADLSGPVAERFLGGRRALAFAALIPLAWAVAVLWYPLGERRRRGLGELPASGDLLIVIGTLTLPQLAALIQIPLKHVGYSLAQPAGVYFGSVLSREQVIGGITVIVLLVASLLAGTAWNQRRWLISAAIFYGIYVCLFTTFFTNPDGFGSGIWGSLNYWLAQQDVKRGSQPVFYYLMMLPTYEYVALAFAAFGIVAQVVRQGRTSLLLLLLSLTLLPLIALAYGVSNVLALPLVVASLALAVAAVRGNPLRQLLLLWFGGLLLGLTLAGEKMPWLTLHLALPLILLAGMTINELLDGALARTLRTRPLLLQLAGAIAVGAALTVVIAWGPGSDGLRVLLFLLALLGVAAAGIISGRLSSPGRGAALSGALLLGLLVPLSLRTSIDLSFVHGDTPYDMLVYTQTSPDLPKIMADVDQYARQSGQGYNQPIVVDANDAFTWPWAWYLRNYHNVSYIDLAVYLNGQGAFKPQPKSILLVNNADRSIISQFPGQFGAGVPYHHRWWFPEDYRGTTAGSFLRSLTDGVTWARWWGFITAEHGIVKPGRPPAPGVHVIGTVNSTAYFPPDYKAGEGIMTSAALAPAPRTQANGALTIGGPGSAPGAFQHPAGLAVDPAGNVYVADAQNNRIQKFDRTGRFIAATSGSGQGALREPWDVAVDSQGMVYVADTWNHRIVKFDAQLHFVSAWGHPIPQTGPDSLLALYGPRALAFDAAGNLLVTDTGDSRVIEFSTEGQPLGSFGSLGSGPGQFQEPVGLAVAPDGTIYVADTWNGRIDVFDANKRFQRSLPVRGWESHSIENKPYLALLPDGNLLLTQPDSGRLVEMNPQGTVTRSTASLGANLPLSRPLGVAAAADGTVAVSDSAASQITRLPVSALP